VSFAGGTDFICVVFRDGIWRSSFCARFVDHQFDSDLVGIEKSVRYIVKRLISIWI
jgi:hypothetical protein